MIQTSIGFDQINEKFDADYQRMSDLNKTKTRQNSMVNSLAKFKSDKFLKKPVKGQVTGKGKKSKTRENSIDDSSI